MARMSDYESKVLPRLPEIEEWARDGFTDKEIALRLLVSENTFSNYKKQYEELREALAAGGHADTLVENAFFKSCVGYKVKVRVPVKCRIDGDDKILEHDEERYIQPNVKAQILWLKNRRPEKWSDRTEVVTHSNVEISDSDRALLEAAMEYDKQNQ
ncbi:MAG: transposase [Bacillota bacterium]|jgi:hypothetical protein